VALKDKDGTPLVKGKKINGFTDDEEEMNGTTSLVPFSPEKELTRLGADFVKGAPFTQFVADDQRFITGQNPMSSTEVGRVLVKELSK